MNSEGTRFDADFLGETPRRGKARTRHEKRMLREEGAREVRKFSHVALAAEVRVEAPVYPTEDRGRVEQAVRAVFPDAVFESAASEGHVQARAQSLARMAEIMRSSRIRDTARQVLKDGVGEDGVMRIRLNKQAACASKVNFVTSNEVLGALLVAIRAEDPEALAEELTWIEGESDERLLGTKLHLRGDRRGRQY